MQIPPQYGLTPNLVLLIKDIESLKTAFDLLPLQKSVEKIKRRKSILKSAVYSARIEGNPKTVREVTGENINNASDRDKIELANIYRAMEFVLSETWEREVNLNDLKAIHSLVLSGLSSQTGSLRQEPSAVFNQAGIAVYLCPQPGEIKNLLTRLLDYLNTDNEPLIPVKAALVHYAFEKIHPFLDGNGRVGRLMVHLVLKKYGFDLRGLVAYEEYLDNYRKTYYDLLNLNQKDTTPFVEFFLNALKQTLLTAVTDKKEEAKPAREESLPPRRYEILQIIKDHRQVSFNLLHRRFIAVSGRLLRYDLKKLADAGFIRKRGITNGAVYEPAGNIIFQYDDSKAG